MKICFMCDLHLPFDVNALQYDVLTWAISDISQNTPDCIVFVGDVTCDGNEQAYISFIKALGDTGISFLYISGNSDMRCFESSESIRRNASPVKNVINGTSIYAINDCDGYVSAEQLELLDEANEDSIVFMHHPPQSNARMLNWRITHPKTALFYGHLHVFGKDGNWISLPALDPDKSIGEMPGLVYYDTVKREASRSYYDSKIPQDIYDCFGISCYNPIGQIKYATERGLKHIELRPNCIGESPERLLKHINLWRNAGGESLSIHLPDVGYSAGKVFFADRYDEIIDLVRLLSADRVTQHVPMVSVGEINDCPEILGKISEELGCRLNSISHSIIIGVENMHMTSKEKPNDSRRFGYTPQECIAFMASVQEKCRHKVGINFDIGHARNNAPYSQKYQISTWFSMLGKHIVAYHLHQVTNENGKFENHMPITHIYGNLISFASFFKCWDSGRINKSPIIFEMRPDDAYERTLATFDKYKQNQ